MNPYDLNEVSNRKKKLTKREYIKKLCPYEAAKLNKKRTNNCYNTNTQWK